MSHYTVIHGILQLHTLHTANLTAAVSLAQGLSLGTLHHTPRRWCDHCHKPSLYHSTLLSGACVRLSLVRNSWAQVAD